MPQFLKCDRLPAHTHQQASLRQRHPHFQTGSEDVLQAGQGAAASHGLGVQGLPAAGVKGRARFRATFEGKQRRRNRQVVISVCHFRNMKTSLTIRSRSKSSTSSSVSTSQRSAKGVEANMEPCLLEYSHF